MVEFGDLRLREALTLHRNECFVFRRRFAGHLIFIDVQRWSYFGRRGSY